MRLRSTVFIFILAIAAPLTIPAQTVKAFSIIASRGGDIVIVRQNGDERRYEPQDIPATGIELFSSDTVQTAPDVFVSILISGSNGSITIAGNTSLNFEKIGGTSNTQVISLIYGRIKVQNDNPPETIIVRAGPSITEIEKGNVSFDYTLLPEGNNKSQPLLSVSTLSGTATVVPSALTPTLDRVKMKERETLSIDASANTLNRYPLNRKLADYWVNEKTSGSVTFEAVQAASDDVFAVNTEFSQDERSAYLKTQGIIAGLSCILGGILIQSIPYYTYTDWEDKWRDIMFNAAWLPIGIGTFILLASYFYLPPVIAPAPVLSPEVP
jgi:hypothetical protein